MPVNNPIKLVNAGGVYPFFAIPKKFKNQIITVTTTTTLSKEKWKFDLIHTITMAAEPLDFNPTPDIIKAALGTGKNLDNKKFALISHVTPIQDGGTPGTPKVNYSVKFESGDELIESEFTITGNAADIEKFYTKVTFKLEK